MFLPDRCGLFRDFAAGSFHGIARQKNRAGLKRHLEVGILLMGVNYLTTYIGSLNKLYSVELERADSGDVS